MREVVKFFTVRNKENDKEKIFNRLTGEKIFNLAKGNYNLKMEKISYYPNSFDFSLPIDKDKLNYKLKMKRKGLIKRLVERILKKNEY